MPRVLTNEVSLSRSVEETPGVLPANPEWETLEPNTIGTYGTTITTVARTPISKSRRRKKGTPTDRDSSVEFESDLTLSAFRNEIEGFLFALAVNFDVTNLKPSAVVSGGYTIAARPAGSTELKAGHLIYAQGFTTAVNNGLLELTGALAAAGTTVPVTGRTAESPAPANSRVSLAGFRVNTPAWAYSDPQGTLTKAGEFSNLNLTPGQFVHIGSLSSAGAGQNGVGTGRGFARVVSVSNNAIVFDKLDDSLQGALAASADVDILFGEFIRDVDTDDDDYLTRTIQFEGLLTGLGGTISAPIDEYEYSIGNYCNSLGLTIPLTNKSTMSVGFVGIDTEDITSIRKPGADNAASPIWTGAFNTSADVTRLRVTDTDEAGLTTDFKSLTLTFNNSVSGEKVVGTVGNKYVNVGGFGVIAEAQVLFTSKAVTQAIKANDTVSMDFALVNSDGAIAVDIPAMTLGGGGREYPVNESVLLNTTGDGFEDDALVTSVGVSLIPVPLA